MQTLKKPVDRRVAAGLGLLALVVIGAVAAVLHGRQSASAQPKLDGLDMQMSPAQNFALVDQTGAHVSLQQLAGHPVVVTFLFTHCPDVCPLTAEKLHTAAQQLGPQASDTRWVAISVDPEGDTPESATAFVAAHHLTGHLQFLLGTQEQLSPVWQGYFVGVQSQLNAQTNSKTVMHSVGAFLLDRHGRERVYLNDGFDPNTLAKDLRILLASS